MISALHADAFVEPSAARGPLLVRKAVMHDIPPILDLINGYAAEGIMLPRNKRAKNPHQPEGGLAPSSDNHQPSLSAPAKDKVPVSAEPQSGGLNSPFANLEIK